MMFGGDAYQGGEEAKAGKGTDEKPLSNKPPLIRCGKHYIYQLAVPGSSNLNLSFSVFHNALC